MRLRCPRGISVERKSPTDASLRCRAPGRDPAGCLTVVDFGNLILNAIIQHNRRHILNYALTPAELTAGVTPCPLELWKHDIVSRAGLLTRIPEQKVRLSLLRKETAVVTEHGVEFRGCYYSSQRALAQKWFETARKRRFNVLVSFDPRLVDNIYVHAPDGKGEPHLATLTARSQNYVGLSFEEVKYYEFLRQLVRQQSEHQRLDNSVEFRDRTQPRIAAAEKRLKAAGKMSRSARRADTIPARNLELALERQEQAKLQQSPAQVPSAPAEAAHLHASSSTPNRQEHLSAIRARMRR